MPLQKLLFKPGINREITSYSNEGAWVDADKIRFRQGFPEKIGGWESISSATFLGVCRSLKAWVTLGGVDLLGVGTNLKFYLEQGGQYNDITPIRATTSLTNPFTTVNGNTVVTVTDATAGYENGDFVTFSGASAVGGLTLNGEFEITYIAGNTYTIVSPAAATSGATGGGSVTATYQINIGASVGVPIVGWGAGAWGLGVWGTGGSSVKPIRLWSQANFGQSLIFGPRGGGIFFWDGSGSSSTRGVLVSGIAGASGVPTVQNLLITSDASRFVFCIGANPIGTTTQNPMHVRWSAQEDFLDWTPSAVNQAGSLTLSRGSELVAVMQARQEILIWSNSALYSFQYVEPPIVWSSQLVGDNISIASQNSMAYANGTAYWMGKDKFYKYDGRTQPLPCDVRRYVFADINPQQYDQVYAGTNEGFHEVWWFYCSSASKTNDRYVVYNYLENTWYYGTMGRTAWLDTGERPSPIAATYNNKLVVQEVGCDDAETTSPVAIPAYVSSGQFDLDEGTNFSFVWRVLPDLNFDGSTTSAPSIDMSLLPQANSGSGYNDPLSQGGSNEGAVTRSSVVPVDQYTGQVNVRVRGRQMAFKIESSNVGVKWQLGSPRIDLRPDGRR